MEGQQTHSQPSAGTDNPFAPPRAEVSAAPEVPTALVPATRGQRLRASIVDSFPFIMLAAMGAFGAMLYRPLRVPAGAAQDVFAWTFAAAGLFLVGWTVWVASLVYRFGQTFGKRVIGIRVVRMDGGRASFGRILFLRNVVISLLQAIPLLGWGVWLLDIVWIFGASRRCLHDLIADTQVVTAASSPQATLDGARSLPFAATPVFDTPPTA